MWWWKIALGVVVVVFTLHQMFQDLFHPTETGALSSLIGHNLFRFLRRWPKALASAGPVSVVVTVFTWAFLLAAGFALIYWAVFPADFQLKTANLPDASNAFVWSFYYSLEMMTTLGMGDIQPNPNWLRLLSACHTLIGFSFLTASITWILLIFPALSRRRTLARKTSNLAEAERQCGIAVANDEMHLVLTGLSEELLIRTRVDLVHFPIVFYFFSEDPRAALPVALGYLERYAHDGMQPEQPPQVRLAARALRVSLDDMAELLKDHFSLTDSDDPGKAFQAYADFHLKMRAA